MTNEPPTPALRPLHTPGEEPPTQQPPAAAAPGVVPGDGTEDATGTAASVEAPHGRCGHCAAPLPAPPPGGGRRPRYCPNPAAGCTTNTTNARRAAAGRLAPQPGTSNSPPKDEEPSGHGVGHAVPTLLELSTLLTELTAGHRAVLDQITALQSLETLIKTPTGCGNASQTTAAPRQPPVPGESPPAPEPAPEPVADRLRQGHPAAECPQNELDTTQPAVVCHDHEALRAALRTAHTGRATARAERSTARAERDTARAERNAAQLQRDIEQRRAADAEAQAWTAEDALRRARAHFHLAESRTAELQATITRQHERIAAMTDRAEQQTARINRLIAKTRQLERALNLPCLGDIDGSPGVRTEAAAVTATDGHVHVVGCPAGMTEPLTPGTAIDLARAILATAAHAEQGLISTGTDVMGGLAEDREYNQG